MFACSLLVRWSWWRPSCMCDNYWKLGTNRFFYKQKMGKNSEQNHRFQWFWQVSFQGISFVKWSQSIPIDWRSMIFFRILSKTSAFLCSDEFHQKIKRKSKQNAGMRVFWVRMMWTFAELFNCFFKSCRIVSIKVYFYLICMLAAVVQCSICVLDCSVVLHRLMFMICWFW
jgi:hypothetical protein